MSILAVGVTAIASGCGSESGSGDGSSSGASGTSGGASGTSGDGTSGSTGTSGGASGTSGGGTSSGSSGTSGTSGGTSGGDLPDVDFTYDPPPRDAALTTDSACAQASATASLQPLDMFVMLDRSQSMGSDCNIGSTNSSRWCRSINALSAYFKSPAAQGNAAALQFFGAQNQCGNGDLDDSVVPGGETGYLDLSPTNTDFDTALNQAAPNQSTPLEGAVRGIIQFTARAANRRPGRQTIGVLITDADTTSLRCRINGTEAFNTHFNRLRDLLQAHYTATGIRTYVVGMTGASFEYLEVLAQGGNAPVHPNIVGGISNACGNSQSSCRHWNVGDGTNNALAEAMKLIQGSAIGCTYQMPTTDAGIINPNNVSVEYEQNGVPPALPLQRVQNAGACVANGWYYDDNTSPSTITLCPAQCTTVQADANAKVRVLLGCLGG